MITYKTDRQILFYVLKRFLATAAILFLPIFFDLFFPIDFIADTYYSIALVLMFIKIIDELAKNRLTEIRFDADCNQVIFVYKTLFILSRQKTLPFDNARLEIAQSKSSWTWLWEPLTLYFLKNKKEVFEIKKSKDGFSIDKLKKISKTVENLSLPIIKV
jgi:hypothetical protein